MNDTISKSEDLEDSVPMIHDGIRDYGLHAYPSISTQDYAGELHPYRDRMVREARKQLTPHRKTVRKEPNSSTGPSPSQLSHSQMLDPRQSPGQLPASLFNNGYAENNTSVKPSL